MSSMKNRDRQVVRELTPYLLSTLISSVVAFHALSGNSNLWFTLLCGLILIPLWIMLEARFTFLAFRRARDQS